jgi:hypothetical protein
MATASADLLSLAQPHPGAAAVFVDELDAGRVEGALYLACWSAIGAASLAARMPGSSWAMMRAPYCACGAKNAVIEPENLSGNLIVQLGLATRR